MSCASERQQKLLNLSQTIFNRLRHDFVEWNIPISISIDHTLGFVDMSSCYAVTYKTDTGFKVNVSSLLFEEYEKAPHEAIRNILAHELLHTCQRCFNHGAEWKRYVRSLNAQHGFKINPYPYTKKKADLF